MPTTVDRVSRWFVAPRRRLSNCPLWVAIWALTWLSLIGCGQKPEIAPPKAAPKPSDGAAAAIHEHVQSEPWGKVGDAEVFQFFLTNANGLRVSLTNLGATIVSVDVPDRDGNVENVTLGFGDAAGYEKNGPYFGCVCGRYANRIAKGKFKIGEEEYTLAVNNDPNHLHGGPEGFHKKVWHGEVVKPREGGNAVKFTYESKDGEEGYPGTLKASVTYSLDDENALRIEYAAQTDKPTPVNLTNHAYWNLAGAGKGTVHDHVLTLFCAKYLPVDETLIPTGERASVEGTPMDFRKATKLGERFEAAGGGYDHCFVIDGADGKALVPAARVREPKSGRVMDVFTTEPGVQLYTGNFLDGSEASTSFPKHAGFCLETQHFPDSPNRPDFPTTILAPGEVYTQTTVYKFSVEK